MRNRAAAGISVFLLCALTSAEAGEPQHPDADKSEKVRATDLAVLHVQLANWRMTNLLQLHQVPKSDDAWKQLSDLALIEVYRDTFRSWTTFQRGYVAHAAESGARMPFQWVSRRLLRRAQTALEGAGMTVEDPLGIGDWDVNVTDVAPRDGSAEDQWKSAALEASCREILFGTPARYRAYAKQFAALLAKEQIGVD